MLTGLLGAAFTAALLLALITPIRRYEYQRGLEAGAVVRQAHDDDVGLDIVRQAARHRQR